MSMSKILSAAELSEIEGRAADPRGKSRASLELTASRDVPILLASERAWRELAMELAEALFLWETAEAGQHYQDTPLLARARAAGLLGGEQ